VVIIRPAPDAPAIYLLAADLRRQGDGLATVLELQAVLCLDRQSRSLVSGEPDANLAGFIADFRARIILIEYLPVGLALARGPLGTILAHTDAVAVTVALELDLLGRARQRDLVRLR